MNRKNDRERVAYLCNILTYAYLLLMYQVNRKDDKSKNEIEN